MRRAATAGVLALVACSSSPTGHGDDDRTDAATAPGADASQPFLPPGHVPALDDLALRCKLISDRNIDDPTPNNTHVRANLRGTDLGIPVEHDGQLYFFFGDTAGAQNIWPLGPESLPDAVGYAAVPASDVAAVPAALCTQLRFLVTSGASGSVEHDFAGAYMTPPAGRPISEFVHNPSGPRGANAFPNLPGDFEVPSGAFSHGGTIYLFYTIIDRDPFEMRGSYLARWNEPSTTGIPTYEIRYHVDERFDANGALGGRFINIAPLVVGDQLYVYGTGAYRASPVHLARKPLAALDTPGGFEVVDTPVVATRHVGELSVRYFPEIDRYVMLDQEASAGNRIAARFAEAPEGPWSAPVTVATMEDAAFRARHCCAGTDCAGERLFECEHAGFYGTYMLPAVATHDDGSFSISFLMSTWIPYNVALMTATFR